ncbi:18.2 kDa class I heat shock protein [Cocos nucifera]|nr:18.2 kDa class I heat shock protein [Cocos nucifera]
MSLVPRGFGFGSSIFDPWDPFDIFRFKSALSLSFPSETSAFASARIDWRETPEAHVFKADLPGLKKEEVKVEVEEGNVLQISGERRREREEKTDNWYRVERSRLPENAKMDQVKAAMENGVLTITVPKKRGK